MSLDKVVEDLRDGGVMSFAQVSFSAPEPADKFLVAVGRILVALRSMCRRVGREAF